MRVAVVVSRYHDAVTANLRAGAVEAFTTAGGDPAAITTIEVPGAWELLAACRAVLSHADVNGVIALGCVIRGETAHDEHISRSVCQGLADLIVQTGTPIGLGLLTCTSMAQAQARAGGDHGNKGREAMLATIEAIAIHNHCAGAGASR